MTRRDPHAPPGWPPGLRCPPLRRRPEPTPKNTTRPATTDRRRRGLEDDDEPQGGDVAGPWWQTEEKTI